MHLGIGAILYPNWNGVDCVIGYRSRSLGNTEHKYLAHKLEFVALKWAIREQFHEYLYGNNFVIHTDNNPFIYILSELVPNGVQWVTTGLLVWQLIILS